MAFRLLIASLVGATGVSGLASVGDRELMQMLKTTDTNVSRQSSSVSSIVVSSKKPWLCAVKESCTAEELQQVTNEFEEGVDFHPYVRGIMTDEGLSQMLSTYPDLKIKCQEDPLTVRVLEDPVTVNHAGRRQDFPWGIRDIEADVHRGRGVGVNVYVLDTGIRISHTLFGGRAFASLDMTTTPVQMCSAEDTTCAPDGHGHGTHVAGTVGASIYGVADGATLWAMKVLSDNKLGNMYWSLYAMVQVRINVAARPAVVTMSLGLDAALDTNGLQEAEIDRLVNDQGVTVVVAAGNANANACDYLPAAAPSAITVTSYDEGGAKSVFSNYGPCIDLWAPGKDIFSLSHDDDTSEAESSGTSMACPHVAGLAAIMYEANPTAVDMTPSQRFDLLTASNRTGFVTGIPPTPATVNLVALAPTPATTSTTTTTTTTIATTTIATTTIATTPPTAPTTDTVSVVPAGTTEVPVASIDGFKAGDTIVIEGGGKSETRVIHSIRTSRASSASASSGVLVLVSGVSNGYPIGSSVTLFVTPSAVGDPHMQNVHGERFDLMKPGTHVMLNIPRGMSAENALLRVQAKAVRLGEHCADMYFQELNITGSWAGAKQIGGYKYTVTQQAATAPAWLSFGPMFREVKVKVVHGVTEGGSKYLNFYVKKLGNVGLAVGGLLGEDDHKAVSSPSGHCGLFLSMAAQSADVRSNSVTSVAAASFD